MDPCACVHEGKHDDDDAAQGSDQGTSGADHEYGAEDDAKHHAEVEIEDYESDDNSAGRAEGDEVEYAQNAEGNADANAGVHADAEADAAEPYANDEWPSDRARPEPKKKLRYRYNNKMLGLLTPDKPELKQLPQMAYFNKVWREHPEHRKLIPRAWMPFAKCTTCVRARGRLDSAKTAEERARLLDMIETHLADVRREKALYYDNRMRARREPKKYMSVVIDGADIRDHDLPHFAEASKLRSEFEGLKVHVYGALVHGHEAVISTVGDHEKQGHNVTIHAMGGHQSTLQCRWGAD